MKFTTHSHSQEQRKGGSAEAETRTSAAIHYPNNKVLFIHFNHNYRAQRLICYSITELFIPKILITFIWTSNRVKKWTYRFQSLRHTCHSLAVKMASLMQSYEQQYSTITADIVSKIGRIPNSSGGRYNW